MPRVTQVLRRARMAVQDFELLKVLESELNQELSSMRFQNEKIGSLGDFVVDWDSPQSQDVVFRKKCSLGEEMAVSAMLSREETFQDGRFPWEALMKVCVKKPTLSSILQFDCVAFSRGGSEFEFDVKTVNYIPSSSSSLAPSDYRGPLFSDLNPTLQDELKQYLVARGIEENFTSYLLLHLHKKEQGQYMDWLKNLKDVMVEPQTIIDKCRHLI